MVYLAVRLYFRRKKRKYIVTDGKICKHGRKTPDRLNGNAYSSFDGEAEIITGIDGDVWDINGPHYDSIDTGSLNECLYAFGTTHENQDHVAVVEAIGLLKKTDQMVSNGDRKVMRRISIPLKAGGQYKFYKYIAVYTSKDGENYQSEAEKLALKAKEAGYEKLLSGHKNNWEEKWKVSEVSIEGDDEAMEALNYSLYHLHSIAPRHSESLSIAARGYQVRPIRERYSGILRCLCWIFFPLYRAPNSENTVKIPD